MFGDCFHDGLAGARRKKVKVLCTCGSLFSAELVQLVDAEDTDVARHAKNGTLHRTRCPECRSIVSVDAPFFFHAREKQKFIVVIPENWRHRALEARADFYKALSGSKDDSLPGYVVEPSFVFGHVGLLEELGEPARREADQKTTRRRPVKAVEELVEQVVDEMIEEVIESAEEVGRSPDGDATLEEDEQEDDETISLDGSDEVEEYTNFMDMDEEDLVRLLDNHDYRRDAALALADKNPSGYAKVILARFFSSKGKERDVFFPAVLRLGREAASELLDRLKAGDRSQARAAARALAALRFEEAVPFMQARLQGKVKLEDAEAYCSALASIGENGRQVLRKELSNPSWPVRSAAVSALSRSCGPSCLEDIILLKKDRSARVRKAVEDALSLLDSPITEPGE